MHFVAYNRNSGEEVTHEEHNKTEATHRNLQDKKKRQPYFSHFLISRLVAVVVVGGKNVIFIC